MKFITESVSGKISSTTGSLLRNNSLNAAIHIDIDETSWNKWYKEVYGVMYGVGEAGHQVVDTAVHAILNNSFEYVPKDTGTLAESGYAKVDTVMGSTIGTGARSMISIGTVGYGGDYGQSTGVVNPNTGLMPEEYAWRVHEDLSAKHPNGGQAKFLERALREYMLEQWPNEVVDMETTILDGRAYKPKFTYTAHSKTFHGMQKNTSKVRTHDTKSNYDRLVSIYEGRK